MEHDRIRVMVVDDTAANRSLMEAFLRKLDLDSISAVNGREAVELFARERPDMILMDLMMPEMDGFEATRRIRQAQGERWVPIVILSALNSDRDVVAGLEAQADDYLIKPISFPVFSAKMRTMLRLLQAQRNLEDALGRMSIITNSVVDGIISIDEAGLIRSVNPAAARIFGYTEAEMLGRNVNLLSPESCQTAADGHLGQFLADGELRELTGRRKNGESFPLELGINAVEVQGGRVFIGVVRDITERLRTQRELADTAARLQAYHDEHEQEQELAQAIMARNFHAEWMDDPRIHQLVVPARYFSGDLVAVAYSGSTLYAMLADATGHGLAAALSLQPALSTFYRGAAEGVPLRGLASRINDALIETLPMGRFIGAVLLSLEGDRGELWVGGVPEAWLVDGAGTVQQRFESANLALGIVPSAEVPSESVRFAVEPGQQIVMCSDGVLEALGPTGLPFGPERLSETLRGAAPQERLAAVQQALTAHLAGASAHDDMSVMIVDCR